MIHKIPLKLSEKMASAGIILSGKTAICAYGLELLFSSVVGIVALFLVSLLLGFPWLWIPYLLGFIPIRLTGGGYHAKTHYGCTVSFTVAYIIAFFVISIIGLLEIISIILSSTALILVIIFAPVESKNKPLKDGLRKRNRRNSILIGTLNLSFSTVVVVSGIILSHQYFRHLYNMYCMGFFAAGISLVAARIIQAIERRVSE